MDCRVSTPLFSISWCCITLHGFFLSGVVLVLQIEIFSGMFVCLSETFPKWLYRQWFLILWIPAGAFFILVAASLPSNKSDRYEERPDTAVKLLRIFAIPRFRHWFLITFPEERSHGIRLGPFLHDRRFRFRRSPVFGRRPKRCCNPRREFCFSFLVDSMIAVERSLCL